MKYITLRESNCLFKHILSVNYVEDWEMKQKDYNTSTYTGEKHNHKEKNPLLIFKTKKWNKLYNLINSYLDNNEDYYGKTSFTDFDVECGMIKDVKYKIFLLLRKTSN